MQFSICQTKKLFCPTQALPSVSVSIVTTAGSLSYLAYIIYEDTTQGNTDKLQVRRIIYKAVTVAFENILPWNGKIIL